MSKKPAKGRPRWKGGSWERETCTAPGLTPSFRPSFSSAARSLLELFSLFAMPQLARQPGEREWHGLVVRTAEKANFGLIAAFRPCMNSLLQFFYGTQRETKPEEGGAGPVCRFPIISRLRSSYRRLNATYYTYMSRGRPLLPRSGGSTLGEDPRSKDDAPDSPVPYSNRYRCVNCRLYKADKLMPELSLHRA